MLFAVASNLKPQTSRSNMGGSSATLSGMSGKIAYFNGQFIDESQIGISPHDAGFLLGVTVTERLRTFGGKLFGVERHFQRLQRSINLVGLEHHVDLEQLQAATEQLVTQHLQQGSVPDTGVCIFVTPGISPDKPTQCIHTYELLFDEFAQLYTQGQPLSTCDIRQVPGNCWPSELKCRSRMHYFLADQQAQAKNPRSRALVCDQEGYVAEATTANVLMYRKDEGLVSPKLDRILPGVSLSFLEQLAGQLSLPMHYRNIGVDELYDSDEILLCSTSPCVVPVLEVDGRPIGDQPGPTFRSLIDAWSQQVGIDIVAQARGR